jgi:hypothetical protein
LLNIASGGIALGIGANNIPVTGIDSKSTFATRTVAISAYLADIDLIAQE